MGVGAADDTAAAKAGASLEALAAEMRANKAAEGVIQTAAADFFDRPRNERGSVLSTARRHLKFIDLFRNKPIGRKTLETHSFDLAALKTKPDDDLSLPARPAYRDVQQVAAAVRQSHPAKHGSRQRGSSAGRRPGAGRAG